MKPKPIIAEIEINKNLKPEDIFALFANEPYSLFLDSALDVHGLGRYSFVARDPFLVFKNKGDNVTILIKTVEMGSQFEQENFEGQPFTELRKLLDTYKTAKIPDSPPFTGGAAGYFGYDLGYLMETIPGKSFDDLDNPDCCLGFYDTVFIYDHYTNKAYIASNGFPETSEEARIKRAGERMAEMKNLIALAEPLPKPTAPPPPSEELTKKFTREGYCAIVQKAIDYIAAGDIFEVNLSQRFSARLTTTPYSLYRYLRHINPAPFASFLNFEEVVIAGASPERYLLVTDDNVETRPIKGTRPRGSDPESDLKLREELYNSAKDRAELVMIIDLERNDLGRVCQYGSVKVPEIIRLEEYATVFHLVSTVTGKLRPDKDIVDLITASFPGGSITGAPKVRSMEIIDELEPTRRSIYTGSTGYIDFNGDTDLNIVIRTFIIKNGQAFFQVGGAVTIDSEPEDEYRETLAKAKALRLALGYGS